MKIGNLDLGKRLLLAPMADVTDSSFRKIAKDYGAGLTFTQMVSAKGIIENQFETLRLLSFHKSEKPVGVQILGKDPDLIRQAVTEIKNLKPDMIDLNCGCSVEKVTKYGMGSSLLEQPKLLGEIVRAMVAAAGEIPISIKIRLGKNPGKINVLENAKIIEDNGATLLTVHARTSVDSYETDVNWEWIGKVKENVSIPVVGNGSCFNIEDITELLKKTGCDSVMLARGALGNPFIFSRYNTLAETGVDPGVPSVKDVRDTILKHFEYLIRDFGEVVALSKAKKHAIWYFKTFTGISWFVDKVLSIQDKDAFKSLVFDHTGKIENDEFPDENLEIINKNFKNKVLFWLKEFSDDDLNLTNQAIV